MRVFDDNGIEVDEAAIVAFFDGRARRCDAAANPNVTLLQDGNETLARRRSEIELAAIRQALAARGVPRPATLDVGCGSGRLYFGLRDVLGDYLGIDGSATLIEAARRRLPIPLPAGEPAADFLPHALGQSERQEMKLSRRFQLVLMSGILIYLNDPSLVRLLADLRCLVEPGALLILREPLGISARLTLKDHWSEDLSSAYSAIYRTRAELEHFLRQAFGERLVECRFRWLYEDPALNNRQETRQGFMTVRLA